MISKPSTPKEWATHCQKFDSGSASITERSRLWDQITELLKQRNLMVEQWFGDILRDHFVLEQQEMADGITKYAIKFRGVPVGPPLLLDTLK